MNNAPSVVFGPALDELEKLSGPVQPALPAQPNQAQLEDAERALIKDATFDNFSETFRSNEIVQRRNALQRQAALNKNDNPTDRQELIVANNAITFYQYVPSIIRDATEVLQRYELLRESIPDVSDSVLKSEKQADSYLNGLNGAVRERTAYANVLLIDSRLEQRIGDAPTLMRMRESIIASGALSPDSQRALRGASNDKWTRGNILNQRIVDVLSGKAVIEGVDQGFEPGVLYINLLKERYETLLNEQRSVVADQNLSQAKARYSILDDKNTKAKKGTGEPLTDDEIEEYKKLEIQINDRNGLLKLLSDGRKEITRELMLMTDLLSEDQINRAELATIQNQFGQKFDFAGVSPPVRDTTSGNIRSSMAKQMEQQSEFHMERMQEFTEVVDGEVLGIGVLDRVEDVSNKYGREAVRRASDIVAKLFTLPVPETFGLKKMAQDSLTAPLREALGWPPGMTDEEYEKLPPNEKAKIDKQIEEKSNSVLDAVRAFDKTTLRNMQSTISLVRTMPNAETYVGQEVVEPLPVDRVTPENRQDLINRYGGATVYAMLFRQMEADFGDTEPATGFMKEYTAFFGKIESTIDVHMDVADAAFKLKQNYINVMWYYAAAAAAAIGGSVLIGIAAKIGVRRTYRIATSPIRGAAKMTRFGVRNGVKGLRLGGRVIGETNRQLGNLNGAIKSSATGEQLNRMRTLEYERKVAMWLKNTAAGRAVSTRLEAMAASRTARRIGKVARVGAVTLIPAVTAYEYYEAGLRADSVEGNDALKEEYAGAQDRTLLQGAGLAATLGLGMLPAIALGAPVVWAKEYADNRSDVVANWKRTGADWTREYDAAGLRGAVSGMTDIAAVEAGGGGTLKPRITLPSSKDQKEAYGLMEKANANSRAEAYEAYFRETQPLLPGMTPDELNTIIRDKMEYLRIATQGTFQANILNVVLQQADTYAELMQRSREFRAKGEPAIIGYEDVSGVTRWIHLDELEKGGNDMMRLVEQYRQIAQPAEDVAMFMMLGERANSRILPSAREKDLKAAERAVRLSILLKLMNHLQDAESVIRSTDWPGIDAYVVSGNTASQNIVRTYLADRIIADMNTLIPQLLNGKIDPDTYAESITSMENILLEVKNVTDVNAYVNTAQTYIAGKKREPRADALGQLLRSVAE